MGISVILDDTADFDAVFESLGSESMDKVRASVGKKGGESSSGMTGWQEGTLAEDGFWRGETVTTSVESNNRASGDATLIDGEPEETQDGEPPADNGSADSSGTVTTTVHTWDYDLTDEDLLYDIEESTVIDRVTDTVQDDTRTNTHVVAWETLHATREPDDVDVTYPNGVETTATTKHWTLETEEGVHGQSLTLSETREAVAILRNVTSQDADVTETTTEWTSYDENEPSTWNTYTEYLSVGTTTLGNGSTSNYEYKSSHNLGSEGEAQGGKLDVTDRRSTTTATINDAWQQQTHYTDLVGSGSFDLDHTTTTTFTTVDADVTEKGAYSDALDDAGLWRRLSKGKAEGTTTVTSAYDVVGYGYLNDSVDYYTGDPEYANDYDKLTVDQWHDVLGGVTETKFTLDYAPGQDDQWTRSELFSTFDNSASRKEITYTDGREGWYTNVDNVQKIYPHEGTPYGQDVEADEWYHTDINGPSQYGDIWSFRAPGYSSEVTFNDPFSQTPDPRAPVTTQKPGSNGGAFDVAVDPVAFTGVQPTQDQPNNDIVLGAMNDASGAAADTGGFRLFGQEWVWP